MIRVYLDSSDYSNMADPRHPWAKDIRHFLKAHVESGAIEIRFSFLHPIEGAHIERSAKPLAVRRAEIMTELSGLKCFTSWHELIREEAARVAQNLPLTSDSYLLQDGGRWFPPLDLAGELDGIIGKGLSEALAETGLPRAQRRYAKRRLLKNGRLTSEAINVMRTNCAEAIAEARSKYPWPEQFFDGELFIRFAAGEVREAVLIDALEESFGNLPFFVGWAFDQHDPDRNITRWLRDSGWMEAISKLRTEMAALIELGRQIGKSERDINAKLRQTRSRMLTVRERILWTKFEEVNSVSRETWRTRVIDSTLATIPSLDAPLEIAIEYFLRSVMASTQPREVLVSDFGDVLHTGYLPYVDIFRCDAYMADLAQKTASRYDTEIVKNLKALPDAIARRLQL